MSANALPLGVYVHWPYCARICPYCDFNVYKNRAIDEGEWRRALEIELAYWRKQSGGRRLRSLYFGGGTPSLAPAGVIEGVVETCEALWGFEDDAEITLEANPTDAEIGLFKRFEQIGINRLSLGVQSLSDDALAFLGRNHTAREAQRALDRALAIFPNSSFDLIYALPDQTSAQWDAELRAALSYKPRHLSLYQLTIEEKTAFDQAVSRGAWAPPDEAKAADLFDLTQAVTEEAGMTAYEISNHAAPGAQSKHNLLYWRQRDYIGIGPGAHGRLTRDDQRIAIENIRAPGDFLSHVSQTGNGALQTEALGGEARAAERLSMGLRLREGCVIDDGLATVLDEKKEHLTALKSEGLVHVSAGRIVASDAGRRVLNSVVAYLLT